MPTAIIQIMIPILAVQYAASRFDIVSATPHRPMFLAGAIQLVLAMLVWLLELGGRSGIVLAAPLSFVVPATYVHTLLMLYGVFPFFMYGFLFTVFPRWMGGPEVPRHRYMAVALTAVLGMIVIYIGLYISRPLLLLGLVLYLAAWLAASVILFSIVAFAKKRGPHEALLSAELLLGAVGLTCFTVGVAADAPYAINVARHVGLWGFLVPVILTVSHRMIPFFTQSALGWPSVPRPGWSLGLFVAGSMLHGLFEALQLTAAQLAVDVALAALAWYHTFLWKLTRSFASRLLAMLHVAFLWFGIGMTLYAVQGALTLIGVDALGRAPLHALGIGFVTGTLIAMATRVTLGHSGLALAVKAPTWYLFLGLNTVALLRVAAELAPVPIYHALNLLAATTWLACLLPWAVRYVPLYLRRRADHRPG